MPAGHEPFSSRVSPKRLFLLPMRLHSALARRTSHAARLLVLLVLAVLPARAQDFLVPMDGAQTDHLRAYGVAFHALTQGQDVEWLLNYRGGSFLMPPDPVIEEMLRLRGVAYERLSGADVAAILGQVEDPSKNMATVRLEKAPRIAVYAPTQSLPWDDAVLMALDYAQIPYEKIYDDAVLDGELSRFDWLHLHHEDFTGQYGKFFQYRNQPWFIQQKAEAEAAAAQRGYAKVSHLKLDVTRGIRQWVQRGGFLFAMCSGTDTFDIALAAHATDIVPAEYDGDPVAPDAASALDFSQTLAFENFSLSYFAQEYEHSDVDAGAPPPELRNPALDFFTLFAFNARTDPVPTMLTQDHVPSVKGFLGQNTAFRRQFIKPDVVVLAQAPGRDAVRYLHGTLGEGTFTFYAGHDPEDYQHFVGDPPTDLSLYKSSPGYRLILNNVLFPAARKKPQKT
jgi:hypothetical protein